MNRSEAIAFIVASPVLGWWGLRPYLGRRNTTFEKVILTSWLATIALVPLICTSVLVELPRSLEAIILSPWIGLPLMAPAFLWSLFRRFSNDPVPHDLFSSAEDLCKQFNLRLQKQNFANVEMIFVSDFVTKNSFWKYPDAHGIFFLRGFSIGDEPAFITVHAEIDTPSDSTELITIPSMHVLLSVKFRESEGVKEIDWVGNALPDEMLSIEKLLSEIAETSTTSTIISISTNPLSLNFANHVIQLFPASDAVTQIRWRRLQEQVSENRL